MESLQVAKAMEQAIQAMGEEGKPSLVLDLIKAKAKTMSEYDRNLGVTVAAMKANGEAVSIIDKQAKGKVFEHLYAKIVAEESLKAHYSRMEQLKAQLNGLQSMNKHLSEL